MALAQQGATVGLTYENENIEKKVRRKLAPQLGVDALCLCDANSEQSIEDACRYFVEKFGEVDFVVHSIAHAPPEDVRAGVLNCSKEGFGKTLNISVFSLMSICRNLAQHFSQTASVVTISYMGGSRVCPGYNVLGIAKASLEASVRYLAYELGPSGTRVNAVSAGPVRTLSSIALPNFAAMFEQRAKDTPLRANTTIEKVGDSTLYLLSKLSRGVTGETHFVDEGFNIMGTSK